MVLTDCLGFLFRKDNSSKKNERRRRSFFFDEQTTFFVVPVLGRKNIMDPSHNLARVTRSAGFDLEASPDEAFVLFGPDREGDWAWGWLPEPVYPSEIRAERGAVFKTSQHGEEVVWVISRYDPEQCHIEYTTFRHADRVGTVSVQVRAREGGSQVEVTYIFTALSEQGKRHIAHFTEEHYREMMADWQEAICHFLGTSETLQP
jgi:hypothetical protein